MVKGRKTRLQLVKQYGHLYTRSMYFDTSICAYCGDSRECLDHVPSLSSCPNIDIPKFLKRGGKFMLLPSCSACNGLLNAKPLYTYLERVDYLITQYSTKLKNKEYWSEAEIAQLGHSLATVIRNGNNHIRVINNKIYHLDLNFIQVNEDEL